MLPDVRHEGARVDGALELSASNRETVGSQLSQELRVSGYAIRLRGIRVRGRIGVTDTERASPQTLVVDVAVELDGESYPRGDELAQAVDYAEIAGIVEACTQKDDERLLESFVLRVARRLGERWPAANQIRVACTKASLPMMPNTDAATVEVSLRRADLFSGSAAAVEGGRRRSVENADEPQSRRPKSAAVVEYGEVP
jgi:dihydroneopterin aldolase